MSFIAASLITAGIGGASTLGAAAMNKGKGSGFSPVANRFGKLEKPLTDYYSSRIGQSGPKFPGGSSAAVAPISKQEDQSFDFLRKFGEGGFGQTFQNAKTQIDKTLTNQFDPTTSPYYQAVKAESARNLQETQRNIADTSAGGGRFYTGARVARQQKAATDSALNLNTIMAALADKERDRAIGVIPQALQFEQAQFQQPLEQAAAFQSLGALPRAIDQAGRTFDVDQFQQSEIDYPNQIANQISALLTGNQPVIQQDQPSGISQLLGGLGQSVGQLGTSFLMNKLFSGSGKTAVPGKGGYGKNTPYGVKDMGTYSKF